MFRTTRDIPVVVDQTRTGGQLYLKARSGSGTHGLLLSTDDGFRRILVSQMRCGEGLPGAMICGCGCSVTETR